MKNSLRILIVSVLVNLTFASLNYLLPEAGRDLYQNPISSFCGKPLGELQLKSPLTSFSNDSIEVLASRDLEDDLKLRIVTCDSERTKLLKTYEENENFTIIRPGEGTFLGAKANEKSSISYVFFVYLEDRSGRSEIQSKLHMQTFVFDDLAEFWASPDVVISEVDAYMGGNDDADFKWVHGNMMNSGPAIISDARILITDGNHDGYNDVVIWKKTIESKLKTEVGASMNKPFRFKEEDLSIMAYDPKANSFSEPRPAEDLKMPEEILWKKSPSVGSLILENYYD